MGALEKERSFFEGKKKKRSVQHTKWKWNTPKTEKTNKKRRNKLGID